MRPYKSLSCSANVDELVARLSCLEPMSAGWGTIAGHVDRHPRQFGLWAIGA